MSFATSGWVHGSILAWLAFSPGPPPKKPRSLYEQEIQPYEKHLVWYSVKDRLPDISPAKGRNTLPPRAREKFNQTLVAGPKDLPAPKQMISMPAPEIKLAEPLPLPNVVAVSAPPRPVKLFAPPVPKPVANTPAQIPDAPQVTPKMEARKLPIDATVAKPSPRAFTPPAPKTPKATTPLALPDAPTVTAAVHDKPIPLNLANPKAPLRAFTPPPAKGTAKAANAATALPDAPAVTAVVGAAKALPLDLPNPRAPLRSFTPPPAGGKARAGTQSGDLPPAPEVASPSPADTASQSSLAVVGLSPTKSPDFPTPPGSHTAGFSAGPKVNPKGGDGATESSSMIVVPGLLAQGGDKDKQPTLVAHTSPTSRESLLAAARAAMNNPPPEPGTPPPPGAARVSSAPDPRLEGRTVYSIAIQMPNITSYTGSWMVWFADRRPPQGGPPPQVRPPLPTRKVDPKYIASAFEEKVEGVVRLFAVIRKDGSVESVSLLRRLDDRLDRSAQEALAKWTFEPALRNGVPMDVDAVFEVPFRIAKPVK